MLRLLGIAALVFTLSSAAPAQGESVRFCIGEIKGGCPSDAVWIPCGPQIKPEPTVEGEARKLCKGRYRDFTDLSQRGGNYCGYNTATAICDPAPLAATVDKGTSTPKNFVVTRVAIDVTQQPKSMLEHAGDCGNNAVCKGAAQGIESLSGVPIGQFVTAMGVANRLTANDKQEQKDFEASLPAGYSYCAFKLTMISIVPREGPRGSVFSSRAKPRGITFQTWTPTQSDGSKSWVDARIDLVGIRDSLAADAYASGKCFRPGAGDGRLLFHCRGGGCRHSSDRGQDVSTGEPGPSGWNN